MSKPYKLIGFGVCGANEKYLENTLKEFTRLCDETVIVGNNIDQKSADLIKSYGFVLWEDNREWGKHQWQIKEDAVRQLSGNWVLTLDMDEVFDSKFTRAEADKLMDKGGLGYFFYVANLYDEGYSKEWSFWNNRMFKLEEPLSFTRKSLHCGLAPELHWRYSNYAPFILKHYGLKDKADRDRKVARYKQFDPQARCISQDYYNFLASNAPESEFNEEKLHEIVASEVKTYQFKSKSTKNMSEKKFYYVKNPAGVILDIPDYQLDETLAREGFSLVSEKPIGVVGKSVETTKVDLEAPIAPPKGEFECEVCGYLGKSKAGLTAHARKHK